FDIDFDPREKIMRGTTLHGNIYFEVPFITNIEGNLWTGGCETGLVLPEEIKHVVSLYKWEQYTANHNLDSSLTITMYDSSDEPIRERVFAVADWINRCVEQGPALVHCQAGLNRSSLVAAASLIRKGRTPTEAIELLREKRCSAVLCNETFGRWLLE